MKTEELIRIQLALECVQINQAGFLERLPCPDPDEIGLVYAYYDGCEYFIHARDEMDAGLREEILQLSPETVFHERVLVEKMLAKFYRNINSEQYHSYLFLEQTPVDGKYPVSKMETDGRTVFAIVEGENVVSFCRSERENAAAGECYVFTEEDRRGKGYARPTVLAWAKHLRSLGKIPFYSHKDTNLASRKLAGKLGLVPCFAVVVYSVD